MGMLVFTAAKNGIAICARNVGSAVMSLIDSFWPEALTPVNAPFFSLNATQPAMLLANATAGEAWSGWQTRVISRANEAAVTGEPSLNFSPFRIVKTYVFPSFETVGNAVAASG